jgi:membrane dipeptidase
MKTPTTCLSAILLCLLAAQTACSAERSPASATGAAESVLERAVIIDTHLDTPQMMLDEGYDLADPASPWHASIPKMREGRIGAAFLVIWVQVKWPAGDLVPRTLRLIDVVHEQVERNADALALATTADEILRAHEQKRIAVLLGIEGGHTIANDLRLLRNYHRLGVRYLTLTHSAPTDWADSSGAPPRWNGLTDFGREVVREMNRLGMMVDVSHASDKTFFDVLEVAKAPVIASHSSCRALNDHHRNMTDEMLRAVAKNGGVVNINFYSTFVDPEYRRAQDRLSKAAEAEITRARAERARRGERLTWPDELRIYRRHYRGLTRPPLARLAEHFEHAVRVAGVDHVGIGSDYDGVESVPQGVDDISMIPNLVRELARRGFSEQDLGKIVGGNMLRVMREVEAASRRMQTGK